MGSSWAFKITASIIKPTRETLLDYSAYLLLTLSIIAIARVIIGQTELKQLCYRNETNVEEIVMVLPPSIKSNNNSFHESIPFSKLNVSEQIVINDNQFCTKYYQAFFPYVLFVESMLLLMVGILWVKMPKVQSMVQEFSRLLHQSRKSEWMKNAIGTLQSNSVLAMDKLAVSSLLDVLFSSSTVYNDKAQARCLYENIQKFTFDHEHSQNLLSLYIRKSIIQLLFWLVSILTNMLLFIKWEFYIGCLSYVDFCSHDTFLRITWFLGQFLLLIYAIFNCASLNWINDNTVSRRTCSLLSFFCLCRSPRNNFHCRPYTVVRTEKVIRNDMALLFHLVSSSNKKVLPYFTAFLSDEWKEKFASTCLEAQDPPESLPPLYGSEDHARSLLFNDV